MTRKTPQLVALVWVREALAKADKSSAHELGWLEGQLLQLSDSSSGQFFRQLAQKPDPASLLKWLLWLGRNSPDFGWFVEEAKRVYSRWDPSLLGLVESFEPALTG